MATKMYFLVEDGKQTGPFLYDELKLKKIEPNNLIWFDGLENWKKAKEIDELSLLFIKAPPPIDQIKDEDIKPKIPPIPKVSDDLNNNFELATYGQRLGGFLITQIITIVLFIILFRFVKESSAIIESIANKSVLWYLLIIGVISQLVNGSFYPIFAGNLGHKLLGLQVIWIHGNVPVRELFKAWRREFFKGALSFFIFPVIWLLFDRKRQNLYDKIESTLVVKFKS